jgi:hypothetical protein
MLSTIKPSLAFFLNFFELLKILLDIQPVNLQIKEQSTYNNHRGPSP